MGLIKDQDNALNLVNSCTATVVDYARQLKETGLDFLVVADPTPSLLSPKQFSDFAKPPLVKVVNVVLRRFDSTHLRTFRTPSEADG